MRIWPVLGAAALQDVVKCKILLLNDDLGCRGGRSFFISSEDGLVVDVLRGVVLIGMGLTVVAAGVTVLIAPVPA